MPVKSSRNFALTSDRVTPVYFGQIGNSEGARIAVQVGTPEEDREERHRDTIPSIPCVRR